MAHVLGKLMKKRYFFLLLVLVNLQFITNMSFVWQMEINSQFVMESMKKLKPNVGNWPLALHYSL